MFKMRKVTSFFKLKKMGRVGGDLKQDVDSHPEGLTVSKWENNMH